MQLIFDLAKIMSCYTSQLERRISLFGVVDRTRSQLRNLEKDTRKRVTTERCTLHQESEEVKNHHRTCPIQQRVRVGHSICSTPQVANGQTGTAAAPTLNWKTGKRGAISSPPSRTSLDQTWPPYLRSLSVQTVACRGCRDIFFRRLWNRR